MIMINKFQIHLLLFYFVLGCHNFYLLTYFAVPLQYYFILITERDKICIYYSISLQLPLFPLSVGKTGS